MLHLVDATMKTTKSGGEKQNIVVSRSHPQGFSTRASRTPQVANNLRKPPTSKSACSSSQESLSGASSVRRKTSAPVITAKSVTETKTHSTPIRMISNLQTTATPLHHCSRKTSFGKRCSNMRRAVSKDSVDFTRDKEKENVKVRGKSGCISIIQLEREKAQLQQQVSELVKNAESKKAEIATLRIEINRLKDLKSDGAVEQLRGELEGLQMENQSLRERLMQLGVPLESTALSDTQKEQILIQRSLSGSLLNLKRPSSSSEGGGPKSLDAEVGEVLPVSSRSLSADWERGSSSSLSEMSVACLQDRIMQMEETHHSTNEELQATLQELGDLQDQLVDLQLEGERMGEEKAVLLESLCSQTEKLEECRSQITQLKELLFQQQNSSERETHFINLLKKAQETNDTLMAKQEELRREQPDNQTDLLLLRDRVRLLEAGTESIQSEKRYAERQLKDAREQLSALGIECSQLRLQLQNEQQKMMELQRERSGCESDGAEARALNLQEQLSRAQREIALHQEHLQQLLEENRVAKNDARKQMSEIEQKVEQLQNERDKLTVQLGRLETELQATQTKCQRHLEDKRELRTNVGDLQKALTERSAQLTAIQKQVEDLKKKHANEVEEWNKFQADLLTTVRVANDFKQEALAESERLAAENARLQDKNGQLSIELKNKQEAPPSPSYSKVTFANNDVGVLGGVDKDLVRNRQLVTKRPDRSANQLSVRSLIESIENATKQVKGQGPSSSCSSSSSSLNSITSESRLAVNSILMSTNNDLFLKPSLRSVVDSAVSKDNSRQQGSEVSIKCEPLKPVSILAGKLDPGRRNSYGDLGEKKDPLSSLVKGGGSKRNALLKWCQNKTLGYKGIDITNFSSSWNDGLAFCALIHSYLPNLIPYNKLDNKDKRKNFTLAFEAAESVGITTTLNTNDLISQERPDWQSIMTYVTAIYKHFEA